MSAEILAFIQSQSGNQVQTSQNVNNSSQDNSQPGLFDSLFTSLTVQDEEAQEILTVPEMKIDEQSQVFTFSGNKSFPQSVIDILSGLKQPEILDVDGENVDELVDVRFELQETLSEVKNFVNDLKDKVDDVIDDVKNFVSEKFATLTEDFDAEDFIAQILNDEEFSEKLNSLPDETKQEVLNIINEAVNLLKNSDNLDTKAKAVKLLENITAHVQAPKVFAAQVDENAEVDDEFDETEEISEESVNASGLAGVVFHAVDNDNSVQAQDTKPEVNNSPSKSQAPNPQAQARNVQNEANVKISSENENVEPEANFSETLDTTEAEQENSNQNNNFSGNQQEDNNSGNFTQSRENFTSSRTSRARSDNRKVDAQNDNDKFSSSTQKTQSHSTFQNFFEGVLSNQRTASRTSPLPLNLNTSANFTQSMTLRDGLVNVVRFIRADGVHKANVVIDPPALGRISVELTSGSSGVEASIKVASEQIRNLIQDQLDQLRMNLSQQGVQVAEFTVDVQQDNSGSQQQNSQQGNQERNFFTIADDEETEEFRVDLEDGLLYWVA